MFLLIDVYEIADIITRQLSEFCMPGSMPEGPAFLLASSSGKVYEVLYLALYGSKLQADRIQ